VRAGGNLDNLQVLDHEELSEGLILLIDTFHFTGDASLSSFCTRSSDCFETCPSEEIFLFRLLKSTNHKNNNDSSLLQFVEENLAFRRSATVTLMKSLQEAIASQQARSEYLSLALNGQKSNEGK
jgi:E3 ubiquitin-protein ligase BRE1